MLNTDQAKILQMLTVAAKPLSFNAIAGNFLITDQEAENISISKVRTTLYKLRCLDCVKQIDISNGKHLYKMTDIGITYLQEYKNKLNGG